MIQPLADRIVVKVSEAVEVTKGGILLPEISKDKPQEGTVVAIGKGKSSENGDLIPMEVKVGDKILFSKFGGTAITTTEGEELLIMKEDEVLAIVK
jgi:chaperonin GroES